MPYDTERRNTMEMKSDDQNLKLALWVGKTTLVCVLLIAVCFAVILGIMIKSYNGGVDISESIVGTWDCIQFYKNQQSFQIPDNQEINVTIDSDNVKIYGSSNASILRGDRAGTYSIEGGSILVIKMGEDTWSCPCVFTKDGLLRLTIPEMEVVMYLKKR